MGMKIADDSVVVFDYVLRDDDGEEIEQGAGDEAMAYLHGHGQIVPGLEAALAGREAGDRFQVVVAPAEGYGEAGDGEVVEIPRKDLGDHELEAGDVIQGERPDGSVETYWVTEVNDDAVIVTPDHPLAGVTLHFEVNVREVRPATAEELEHGHAHFGEGHDDDAEGEDERP